MPNRMTRTEAHDQALAAERDELMNMLASPYGAEQFVNTWIADPAETLSVILNAASFSRQTGEDDQINGRMLRELVYRLVTDAAAHIVSTTDASGKVLEYEMRRAAA